MRVESSSGFRHGRDVPLKCRGLHQLKKLFLLVGGAASTTGISTWANPALAERRCSRGVRGQSCELRACDYLWLHSLRRLRILHVINQVNSYIYIIPKDCGCQSSILLPNVSDDDASIECMMLGYCTARAIRAL